jgi:DNA-binding transcriptional regulator PaaX
MGWRGAALPKREHVARALVSRRLGQGWIVTAARAQTVFIPLGGKGRRMRRTRSRLRSSVRLRGAEQILVGDHAGEASAGARF